MRRFLHGWLHLGWRFYLGTVLNVGGVFIAWTTDEPYDDLGYLTMLTGFLIYQWERERWRARNLANAEVIARIEGRMAFITAMMEAQTRGMSFEDFMRAEIERDMAYSRARGVPAYGEIQRVGESDGEAPPTE